MSLIQKALETAIRLIPEKDADPLIGADRVVGQPLSRVDGPLKVTGTARYAAEIAYEQLSYAALAYSTIARGRITALDTAAAAAVPGVLLVMTYANAPRMAPPP